MLKRTIGTIAAILVAGSIFVGCGSTDNAAKEAEAAPAEPVVTLPEGVVANWDFTKKPGEGTIESSYKTFMADVNIPADKGSKNATLTLTAGSETKYLTEPDPFLAFNKKDSTTLENIVATSKAKFLLETKEKATIVVEISGNGDPMECRAVAIADNQDNILAGKDKLGKQPFEIIYVADAEPGVYSIYAGGARIHRITVTHLNPDAK